MFSFVDLNLNKLNTVNSDPGKKDATATKVALISPALSSPVVYSLPASKPPPLVVVKDTHSPLVRAVMNNDGKGIEANKHLIHATDESGYTAMTMATEKRNVAMIRLLKSLGADPNQTDKNGLTPLRVAYESNDQRVASVLIECGADPNKPDRECFPLELARLEKNKSWEDFLVKKGADSELCDEWMDRRELAHLWGIERISTITGKKGSYACILQGWPRSQGAKMLEKYFSAFLKETAHFTPAQKNEMLECVKNSVHPLNAVTNDELVERVNKKKVPVVVFGGSDSHTISSVVTPNRLYVCNRGAGRDATYSMMVYELPKEKITADLFAKLRANYSNMDKANAQIKGLGLKHLPNESAARSNQAGGHCIWASGGKGAANALIQHYGKGNEVYKEFTAHSRKGGLLPYLKGSKNHDRRLVKAVQYKLTQNIKEGKKFYTEQSFEECFDLLVEKGKIIAAGKDSSLREGF